METDKPTVEAYFSYPKDRSTHNAILIITDVIGHKFLNVQLYGAPLLYCTCPAHWPF